VASTASTPAADLVVSTAPALVAAAVAVVVLRLLPPVVRLWRRATGRRPGLVPFVAAARTRVLVAPVLSLVLVGALLALSVCVLATVRVGQEAASWQAVGGDVVVTAAADEDLELPDERPGLLAAGARVVDGAQLLGGGVDATARLVALDADAERELLARTPAPDAPALERLSGPAGPNGADRSVPALVDGVPPSASGLRLVWQGNSVALDVVGPAPALPAGSGAEATVVVDRAVLADVLGSPVPPTTVWLAGPAAQEAAAATGGATTTSRTEWLDDARDAPTSSALTTLLTAGAALLLVLGAVTVVLTAAQGRPARRRASTQLRVLGMRRAASARLALGELAPPVLAASVVGVLTGVGLGAALTSSLGLSTVTRQVADPALVVPSTVVLGMAVPALALLVAVAGERPRRAREDLARVMRAG
jgi:putative ABC transport system permease protein